MPHRCCVCGIDTIFFIWSSTRNFPTEELMDMTNISKRDAKVGSPVCMKCYEKMIND